MIYAPVRSHPDGGEWVQWLHCSHMKSWVQHLVKQDEKLTPGWVKKYPVIRIAEFTCTETKEG